MPTFDSICAATLVVLACILLVIGLIVAVIYAPLLTLALIVLGAIYYVDREMDKSTARLVGEREPDDRHR